MVEIGDEGGVISEPSSGGYFTSGVGPHMLPITFTLENDSAYSRTEVVGVTTLFPDDGNSVSPAELPNFHMYLEGGRETIGFAVGNFNSISRQYSVTLPWTGPLNGVTAASGNILPGSVRLSFHHFGYNPFPTVNYGKLALNDSPIDGTTGQWVHAAIESSSINYTTGAITVKFTDAYLPEDGQPIRVTYKFASPVKYPTQWTVLRTWPSGKVRQAKAWIGQSSGVGVLIPPKISSLTGTLPTTVQPASEYTRAYLRIGLDPTVNTLLPTYTQHAAMASALSTLTGTITSQVFDSNNNPYYANLLATGYEENNVEDPANNAGKGWMKVIQRRTYHTSSSDATFGSITRDFLSSTSYLYIPHNSRMLDIETRLGNDYAGADPVEHTFTEALAPTGNGSTLAFSGTLVNVFASGDGRHGHARRGRVKILSGSTVVAQDTQGDGVLRAVGSTSVTGTVDYATGAVAVSFAPGFAPNTGVTISCEYKTYYIKIGTATGVQTLSYTLPTKASQYGVHVRVGGGATAIYEGWDGGGQFQASVGQIVPYNFTTSAPVQVSGTPLSTTTTGTASTNLVPGTVGFFVGATDAGNDSVVFCRDDGVGGLTGRGVTSGTINYVSGAFSITFATTPTVGHNLYAVYGRTSVARPISGALTYSTRALTVTTSQSVPASTPVFVSYIRNNLASKSHDPNNHPLGSVGINKWVLLFSLSQFADVVCEAAQTYQTSVGSSVSTRFATVLSNGVIPGGGADPYSHEHMHDGTSVSRLFFLYCGSGSPTVTETNTWNAKKVHPITTLPTLDAYNATKAFGLLEGSLKIVTPEQAYNPFEATKRTFTEDIGRRASALTVPYPSTSGNYINKEGSFSCVDAWNLGAPTGCGSMSGELVGARTHLKWRENFYTGVNSGGAQRALHDSSIFFLYPQAWQGLRYLYHASMFNVVRPGALLWNCAMRSKWEDRAYQNYIPTSPSSGMIRGATAAPQSYLYGTQEFLGRGWRFGWSDGTVRATNGSTRIEFNAYAGLPNDLTIVYNWSSGDVNTGVGGSFQTPQGTSTLAGRRRMSIAGSYKTYLVTDITYDNAVGRWVGTLDSAYRGPTTTGADFGLMTDPVTGTDITDQRNDPRFFPQVRIGCRVFSKQSGIEGDSSSHQSADSAFDVWNATGSWMLWDIVRHRADWNMSSVKEFVNGGFFQDQMRTNAWTTRTIITAYSATKYLATQPGFSFLTDPDYGVAPARFAEWLRIRWTQWVDYGARGEMDPYGTIATGTKSRIKDIRITSSSDKADWYSMASIGSPNSAYGGGGTYANGRWSGPTEAQLRFDDLGFDYISVWEIGYITPWMTAVMREFRFDNTMMQLPIRGEPAQPFSQIISRVFNAYAAFMVDYGYITDVREVQERGFPGFVGLSGVVGTPAHGLNADTTTGAPIRYVVEHAGTPIVRNTYEPITWPTLDDNYIAQQVYWLRGAARSFHETREAIDRLGYALPGKTPPPILSGRSNFTSFEFGWHHGGVPYQGASYIDPGPNNINTNPHAGDVWSDVRAPQVGETCVMVGRPYVSSEALLWSCAPFLMQITQFGSSALQKAQAGDILNRMIWQTSAMSLVTGVFDEGVNEYGRGLAIEQNYFAGPITGGFPYSTEGASQPLNRWSDTSYNYRRQITSGTTHSQHTSGLDCLAIDLDAYGIHLKTSQVGSIDIRVIRQLLDGTNQVCESTVRQSPGGQWTLYVKSPRDIPANQAIQNLSGESWYIYYTNPSAGAAAWSNTLSIDAPYASDGSTGLLWNQNGNISTDAGPNSWALTPYSPTLAPDYVDGPFGGAVGFTVANFDTAISAAAMSLVSAGSARYLGSSYTVDFFFKVTATKLEADRTLNYGIFSAVDDTSFPMLAYIENSTQRLLFLTSLGGTSGYTISNASAQGPSRATATGNGSLSTFTFTLPVNLRRQSLSVVSSNGTINCRDINSGFFTGTGLSASSINYSLGTISVTTSTPLPNGVTLAVYYTNNTSTWATDIWNHVSVTYNGQNVQVYVNGNLVGIVLASGAIQPIPANTASAIALGALLSPGQGFTARSNISIAEFRISSVARPAPRKLPTPALITLLAEESQVAINTCTSPPCNAYIAPAIQLPAVAQAYIAKTISPGATQQCDASILRLQNAESTGQIVAYIAVSGGQVVQGAAATIRTVGVGASVPTAASIAAARSSTQQVDAQILSGIGSVSASSVAEIRANGTFVASAAAATIAALANASLKADAAIQVNNKNTLDGACVVDAFISRGRTLTSPNVVASISTAPVVVVGALAHVASTTAEAAKIDVCVTVLNRQATNQIVAQVAGLLEEVPLAAPASASIALARIIGAKVECEIVGPIETDRLRIQPAAATISTAKILVTQPSAANIAVAVTGPSPFVNATLQVARTMLIPTAAAIKVNDHLLLNQVDASIGFRNLSVSAQVDASVLSARSVTAQSLASVLAENGSTTTDCAARIVAPVMGVFAEVSANIRSVKLQYTQEIEATVVTRHEVELPGEVALNEIYVRNLATCTATVFAGIMEQHAAADATVATASMFKPAEVSASVAAQKQAQSAVCRAFVVIPLNQTLNASGVSASSGDRIQGD